MPLLDAIADNAKKGGNYRHNWNVSEYKRRDELSPEDMYSKFKDIKVSGDDIKHLEEDCEAYTILQYFREECEPYREYGIHSIRSIVYYPKPEKVRVL